MRFSTPIRLAALSLPLLALLAPTAWAHGATGGDLPLTPRPVRLQHLRSVDVVALFARETLPTPSGRSLPRAARSSSSGSLLPAGIEAVLRSRDPREVVLVGAPDGFDRLLGCLAVVDAPAEQIGPNRRRVTLTLRHASASAVRRAIRRQGSDGSARIKRGRLVLEGAPEWLHRALREVIRAELQSPTARR